MICFYHGADLDGHCSGAIVKLFNPRCEMYPINHGDHFPWEEISTGETVFMTDFSLKPFDDMIGLNEIANLVWIDHHKTAINASNNHGVEEKIDGLRSTAKAGCELAWEFFNRHSSMPYAVYLLGRYDVWDHRNPDVLPFQKGMQIKETDPRNSEAWDLWRQLLMLKQDLNQLEMSIIEQGKTVIEYQDQVYANLAKWLSFEMNFKGYKFISANVSGTGSKFFDVVWDENKHDAMLVFSWTGTYWNISMYTTPEKIDEGIDVGEIARIYNGGGHAGAAGFQSQKLPFKLEGEIWT